MACVDCGTEAILNPLTNKPRRMRGHVEAPNKPHLREVKHAQHRDLLRCLPLLVGAPPADYDARTLGFIGPVKDQAQCGSCWDFSGTFVAETAQYKAGVLIPDGSQALSEEYTLDCGKNGGCNGDDNTTVLAWAKETGLPLTSAYGPYTAGSGRTGQCKFSGGMKLYKVDDWGFAAAGGGQGVTPAADIKAAIMAYGCVGCSVAADDAFEAWGESGASFDKPFKGSGSHSVDHDVALVGWHDDASLPGGGYWIMRNSWGSSWGVGGYMAIAYSANVIGGEAVWAVVKGGGPVPWLF
jgi:C1A family cysteine protease